ncbi:uncharacterized protein DUF5063 [Breznakibacter xylanolyticus]|uniref:Uncharacterized protein DUF5063 n=1 Tax=Breznakibacter xylanolyticus TaxID=990 RepID=A0A2W7N1D3_9BACT|nr:DUF5063 domain-containing protein [Breznakibacter xylanolyticus]PZX13573.1 uncharacterized protein DUF5063 [Breznakibacter xylanolyticus]
MDETFDHLVYSKNVIEFVTVGREYCHFLEHAEDYSRKDFFKVALRMLPLLYLKAVVLPKPEQVLDDMVEKSVTESWYETVKTVLEQQLGAHNVYLEVFTPDIQRADTPVAAFMAEDLTDIYQDVKDFLEVFKTGVTELMNDALYELVNNFETYWGQKAVNCMRALHNVNYGDEPLEDDESDAPMDEHEPERQTDNWIFTQRRQQWNLDSDLPLD